jgi:hypothetical protein
MNIWRWAALAVCILVASSGLAAEGQKPASEGKSGAMLGINVVGSKEAPKVLTIVPWRMPPKLTSEPAIEPVWNPVPEAIDPDSFRRNLQLFERARGKEGGEDSENANQ